jgi:acetyl esterase/lipase
MHRSTIAIALLSCLAAQPVVAAAPPLVIELWPGKVPGDVGIPGEEKFFELKVGGKPYQVGGKPTKWLTNVTKPTITIYRPPHGSDERKDTAGAMIICPGGGYHNLGWDVEGEEIAAWLNSIGLAGIILKYRCPRRPGDAPGVPPAGPLKDAQRAVSVVRSKAKEWGIDPAKIGMVGFSAGGHLVGATATNFEKRTYEPIDDIDKASCRPDFAVMLYSGYFNAKLDRKSKTAEDNDQSKEMRELSPTIPIAAGTPPLFLVHATDDPISNVEHSVTMYLAMKRAGVPAELHVYATGGHGFGVRRVDHPCASWTERCTDWLRQQAVLKSVPNP